MSFTMLFPATEALLRTHERIQPRADAPSALMSSKSDFDMNSIFEQAIAIDSAVFAPFPKIAWPFESDESDNEEKVASKKLKNGKKKMKQFDDLLKAHRKQIRSKHGSANHLVRSKRQFNGLSCLGGAPSSMQSLQSFVRLTRSS
uniref:Uncharacterized protein n=1 Tax=Amphora coffeiformis TaxID=265554 RepID=A0A7S3L8Q9_9STRA